MNKLNFFTPAKSGLITIRPKLLLGEIENTSKIPVELNLQFPSSEIGSLTTLEATMLSAILYLTKPKNIFEFGTFLGYSTALFLRNSEPDCKVFSIDLPNDGIILPTEFSEKVYIDDVENDNYLSSLQLKLGEVYLSGIHSSCLDRLTLIKQNSLIYNPVEMGLVSNVDFIFIDGGHTTDLIKHDTKTAKLMVSNGGVIIWHDYNSKIHGDVSNFVDEYAKENVVYHISNTMLAFTII